MGLGTSGGTWDPRPWTLKVGPTTQCPSQIRDPGPENLDSYCILDLKPKTLKLGCGTWDPRLYALALMVLKN